MVLRTALIAVALAAGCSTFTSAHHDSLASRASADFSCPKEQLSVTEGANDVWTAQGCGQTASYKLTNKACLIERDCNWAPQ
jgi:hypothetical protein